MTSRARHGQEPKAVASAWQPDTPLSDLVVMSNLTFEPCLIYRIKGRKCPTYSVVVIFEELQAFKFFFSFFLFISSSLCLFLALVY